MTPSQNIQAARIARLGRRLVGLTVVCVFLSIELLNYTGFCWSEFRYYSDQDFLDAAVQANLKFQLAGDLRDKMYATLDQFYRENPNCCRLYKWGHDDVADFRLVGFYVAVAEIWYRALTEGPTPFYQTVVTLDACRRVNGNRGMLVYLSPRERWQ
jgi:hypothetical protein